MPPARQLPAASPMPIVSGPSPASMAELRAATLALKAVDKGLRKDMNQATRETLNPIWREALAGNASTSIEQALLVKGARVAAGNPPRMIASASKRALNKRSTLVADRHGRAFEFGSKDQEGYKAYTRKNRTGSGTHQVKRRTSRQLPAYKPQGRVIFPAVADTMPRMVSLWASIILRKVYEAFEGK